MNMQLKGYHKAFESRIRLSIMSILAVNDSVDFSSLKEFLELTDGNLAGHLKALEKEDFIQVSKKFIGRKPNTCYAQSKKGKKAFEQHLLALERFILSQK